MSELLDFLDGTGVDIEGRTIEDVLALTDRELEESHNYIQWIFPLLEESENVLGAPVILEGEIQKVRGDVLIQKNIQRSLSRMIDFYKKNDHWFITHDHNHLRITRILKSIRMLVSLEEAENFYNIIMERVKESGNQVLPEHIEYWTDTIGLSFVESS